ncbi:hypothetical protein JD276_15280 [Leucobacter sp. CSA1]|uniref:Uncharacterized protein n=1 Tax=Leucobacter chromiisoli TaxID=2796471 RepID=A0A934Q8X1_9MICO|nr:hypothetical protein [Leucobacter chromiisoli]MBK0420390.1 hypothetical protein [Leucobacter chromiisoli]
MSADVSRLDVEAAQRRAERIRFHATNANEAMRSLQKLVHQARELEDHVTLGYASWPAYIQDLFGDEPLRLARDVRRELVAELAEAGMSTRAIAPIVGVSKSQVAADIEVSSSGHLRGESDETPEPPAHRRTYSDEENGFYVVDDSGDADGFYEAVMEHEDMLANTKTGEVIEDAPAPVVTEHSVTEKVKTITGLDGKEYKQKPREPKPVPSGEEANRLNAVQAAKGIGSSLETLLGLTYESYRDRIITEWWPLGKHDVPPSQTELFTPSQLRHIAQGLTTTAAEMEAHHVQ